MKRLMNDEELLALEDRNQIWSKLLESYCPSDELGNKPCDWGCICDRCQYDWELNHRYATILKAKGMDYSFYAKYLEDDGYDYDDDDYEEDDDIE